ncbi:MAG TPA: 3-deoxy-7-phosphoheptulonate synthase [Candidatus Baltobacteraceae bacterium]|jgi:3-deoxy-7-phosphoheptulonate synthase|nr:3-deoxy-7-phosphoheptulonate synthase [Candidatus Baltobacteraceae bacterium]
MYELVRRSAANGSVVEVGNVRFGEGFVVIAGPCAVEDEFQMEAATRGIVASGAAVLRGGAYKPRTSPYSFQGLGDRGVELIASAARRHGIPAVVEALAEDQLPLLARNVGMIQIGARNMQNFALLRAVARTGRPILLKRGPAATLDELLYAAEYVLLEGNPKVVLCERGIRGFDPETRNVFDLAGALRLKELTHLPVIADPSHATGRRSLIAPLVAASAAAGLDGAMVEVHPDPARSKSDAEQALDLPAFEALMAALGPLCAPKVAPVECRL